MGQLREEESGNDSQNLLEELRVQQEELEAQNQELRRFQKELEVAKERYRNLYDSAPVGYLSLDDSLKIADANQACRRIFGTKIEKIVGSSIFRFASQSSGHDLNLHFFSAKELGDNSNEIELKRYDGSSFFADVKTSYKRDGTSSFNTLIQDITERKKAEMALKESEERFSKAFHGTVAGKAIFRLSDGRFIDANDRWLKLNGLTREETIGRTFADLNIWTNAEDWKQLTGELKQNGFIEDKECEFRRKSGETWISLISSQIIELSGEKVVLASQLDISDRKRAEEELKRSNEELRQFAYVASHDLQEPLRMVTAYLGLLERRYNGKILDDQAREYICFATQGADRMRELIEDLLEYSRVDTKGKAFAPTDMNNIIERTKLALKASIEESQASIELDKLPTIMADEGQMIQLMQNLLSNSIKFRGDEPSRIHVSCSDRWNHWTFSIRDNGIGLNMEYADVIFRVFQQLHSREEYPGTGIGLAICKKIVERHGGRIWVESEEGKGSTFFFTISKNG